MVVFAVVVLLLLLLFLSSYIYIQIARPLYGKFRRTDGDYFGVSVIGSEKPAKPLFKFEREKIASQAQLIPSKFFAAWCTHSILAHNFLCLCFFTEQQKLPDLLKFN